jgi:putative transposase
VAASYTQERWEFSERRACRLVGMKRSSARYMAKRSSDAELRERLRELAG